MAQKSKATQEQLNGRRRFDTMAAKILDGINLISQNTLAKLMELADFNVRRLAHIIAKRNKKLLMEAAEVLKSRFGTYGGLIPHRHIA